jgi:predicted site-specific integrase-resolvase
MPRVKLTNRSVKIAEGRYLTLAQVAQRWGVYPQTVLYWVNRRWLRCIRLPGLGYIVNERDLATFVRPPRGRKSTKA